MIVRCRTCNVKNRIFHPPRNGGVYECGSCHSEIVDTSVPGHSRVLFDAIDELQHLEVVLGTADAAMPERNLSGLQSNARKAEGHLRAWEDFVLHLTEDDKKSVLAAYGTVILEAKLTALRVTTRVDTELATLAARRAKWLQAWGIVKPVIELVNNILAALSLSPISLGHGHLSAGSAA